ncbi:MAG: hypothetical protein GYB67_03385, partial [Chloroflexi bacterium]|nr:hypothetical protein [Chloroflexota bacterium]
QLASVALFALAVSCAGPPPRAVLTVLIVGLVANSVITILQAEHQAWIGLTILREFRFSPTTPGVSVILAGDWRYARPYGLLPHPNLLAGSLLIGVLAAATWVLSARRWRRFAGITAVGLGFWALLLTFSRAAWGGLVVGGLIALVSLRPFVQIRALRRSLIAALAVVVIIGGLFFAAYQPLLLARVGVGAEATEIRSVVDRVIYTELALQAIGESPVLGVGLGNFPQVADDYLAETSFDLRGDQVHNVLLAAWAELGVIGLVLLLTALISGVVVALRHLRQTDHLADRAARIGLLAGVGALFAVGWFDHYPWTILHFQIAWWGLLAAALQPPSSAATLNR